jgi:polyhydroxyalkanoate synthase
MQHDELLHRRNCRTVNTQFHLRVSCKPCEIVGYVAALSDGGAMSGRVGDADIGELWGDDLLGRLDPLAVLDGLRSTLAQPTALAEAIGVVAELALIAAGQSTIEPSPRDARFADPAWRDNSAFRMLAQSYLSCAEAMNRLAARVEGPWEERARARFATDLVVSAVAPTNLFLTNPAAMARAFETGGASLARGARNFLDDLLTNGGMPRCADSRPFRVGETVALTPGAVVHRDDVFELIQYAPSAAEVHERPVVLVPPQINKYWFMDMAPGRSLVEFGLSRGMQMFAISWRNPDPEHRAWGLDRYVEAVDTATDVAAAIVGADAVSTISLCAGGITTAAWLGHLAARGEDKVVGSAFGVTMLDFSEATSIGMFATAALAASARKVSERSGVLDGRGLATLFAALRPDDMIWRYWVNNYLLGDDPPAFDLLAWNADPTRLPASLHADFLEIMVNDSFATADALNVLGSPIDLGKVPVDVFGVGAEKDHLTPWTSCYRSLQHFGGDKTFVQSSSGHIQSLVNPPGNPRMWFRTGPPPGSDPAAWLEQTSAHEGSWWEPWSEWCVDRLGDLRPPPAELGSAVHPPLEAAPGTYVHAK